MVGGGHSPCTWVRRLHPTSSSGNPALTLTPHLPPSSRDCAILGASLSLKSPNHPVGRCGLFPAGTPQGRAGPLRVDSETKLLTSKSCLHPPSCDSRSPITSLGLTFLICEMGTKLLPPPISSPLPLLSLLLPYLLPLPVLPHILPHLPLLLLNFPRSRPQESPFTALHLAADAWSLGRCAGSLGSGWQLSALSLGPDEEVNVNH